LTLPVIVTKIKAFHVIPKERTMAKIIISTILSIVLISGAPHFVSAQSIGKADPTTPSVAGAVTAPTAAPVTPSAPPTTAPTAQVATPAANPAVTDSGKALDDQSFNFNANSEPDGFRGIKWGTDLSTITGIRHERTQAIGGSLPEDLFDENKKELKEEIFVELYVRDGDELKVEGTPFEKVEYGFYNGKFCEVLMIAIGSDNWVTIRDTLLKKYGKVVLTTHPKSGKPDEYSLYVWAGKTSEMELLYTQSRETVEFWIGSSLQRNLIFEGVREKIKKAVTQADQEKKS
jgi:hypothetical protein